MSSINKKKIIIKIVTGYILALSLMLGIVFFSLHRLDKIEKTVDGLINDLAVTRALSQSITSKIRLVRFHAERYKRYYRQGDLDQFNEKMVKLKRSLQEIEEHVKNTAWVKMIQYIRQETIHYETQFECIVKLIMKQQSLLSTVFIKQELLIENQLSAIRINVGIIQNPDIFFSFGNARQAFQLMRLYQAKYLYEADEKYFIMFRNNYHYASEAFDNLNSSLLHIPESIRIRSNTNKAKKELQMYYEIFLKIRSASIALKKATCNLDIHELQVTKTASDIVSKIEEEYQIQNKIMQSLVLRTQVELVIAVIIAIILSFGLFLAVSRKITTPLLIEMQKKTDELDRLAKLDGLTGIANRRLLDERLSMEWKRLKREQHLLSVILMDIDYFKAYNDYYGHQKGDDCIYIVANTIDACLKRPADLAGRYGGEEFLVILPNTNTNGAVEVAQDIRKKIADIKINHAESKIAPYLTLSFGVASVIPCEGNTPEKLVSQADQALYEAKRQGRDQVQISPVSPQAK